MGINKNNFRANSSNGHIRPIKDYHLDTVSTYRQELHEIPILEMEQEQILGKKQEECYDGMLRVLCSHTARKDSSTPDGLRVLHQQLDEVYNNGNPEVQKPEYSLFCSLEQKLRSQMEVDDEVGLIRLLCYFREVGSQLSLGENFEANQLCRDCFLPALPSFISLLSHPLPVVRGLSAQVIGYTKDPSAPVLVKRAFAEEKDLVSQVLMTCSLSEMGPSCVEFLSDVVLNSSLPLRFTSCQPWPF